MRTGGALRPLDTRLRLDQGEEAYADATLTFSRHYQVDAVEERPWSYLSPPGVIGSALRNWSVLTRSVPDQVDS